LEDSKKELTRLASFPELNPNPVVEVDSEEKVYYLNPAAKQLLPELKQAKDALFEQSRILETFFTSTVTPLVFLDRSFNFIRVNDAYARVCQRKASDFPGRNHFEFYPSDAKAIFEQVVETRVPYQAIARPFAFPDHPEWGTTYWDWTLTPIIDTTGEVEFLVFSLNDVTERWS
jgi:PAS domain S-box-containing protein